jgi:hypothetical protein
MCCYPSCHESIKHSRTNPDMTSSTKRSSVPRRPPCCARCDTDGVSAVPFITWSGGLPLLGDQIRGLLQGIAHATGAALLRRTGEHFFLLDGGGAADSAAPVPEAAPEKGRQRQTAFGTADADQPLLYQVGKQAGLCGTHDLVPPVIV